MAIIYRYALKDQDGLNLLDHESDIAENITRRFGNNLKEKVRITSKYFEFKLYDSVDTSELRGMGKDLAHISSSHGGFRRIPQKMYALVYQPEEYNDSLVTVDFFDAIDIDESERFYQQAEAYTDNFLASHSNDNVEAINGSHSLQNAFYIDILSAEIKKSLLGLDNMTIDSPIIFEIFGLHQIFYQTNQYANGLYMDNNEERVIFEKMLDAVYMENDNSYNSEVEKYDALKILCYKQIQNSNIDKISDKINFKIQVATNINALGDLSKINDLKFTVHKVGQGLCTSFSDSSNPPFLFFDFGIGVGWNTFTKPINTTGKIIPNSTIIISHVHRDHWFRIKYEKNAFKCDWYFPDQSIKGQLRHKCAEIIYHGGTVSKITSNISFLRGILLSGSASNCAAAHTCKKEHETGLSLRINTKDINNNTVAVLIPGDQCYDCINTNYLNNINVLVASHHGGEYAKNSNVSVPVPFSKKTSRLIYSYGLGINNRMNTYGHPSRRNDYSQWAIIHETAIDGDYVIHL